MYFNFLNSISKIYDIHMHEYLTPREFQFLKNHDITE